MSLTDAITTIGGLGGKINGDLIKHEEWNALITSVSTIGTGLQDLEDRVTNLETFVGFEADVDYTLRERIEAIENFVGEATDTSDTDTLSGRVTKLEEIDVVEQNEFNTFLTEDYNDFKASVDPLRDQYVVTLDTPEANYNLGERAEITATVRTLDGDIPPNHPWVDFIVTWGKLKSYDGFTTRTGIDGHSISVRTDAQGIAKVRISAEQAKGLSDADETQVEGFFDTIVTDTGKTVKETLNAAPNASSSKDAPATRVFNAMKQVYQHDNKVSFHRFADGYYRGTQAGLWQGGISFGINWEYYRSTVVAIAKEDGDPTTPNNKSAASAIQITYKDWVGPWIDWYFKDDDLVTRAVGLLGPQMDPNIYVTLDGIKSTLEREIQSAYGVYGLIYQNKMLNAFGEAVNQMKSPVDPDVGEKAKETVIYGIGTQQSWNVLQYTGGPTAGGDVAQPGFNAIMDHAIKLATVDTIGGDVKDLKGSVGVLQDTSSILGTQVLGGMSNMENKIVEFNVPDREVLVGNIHNIQKNIAKIDNMLGTFNLTYRP